MHVHSLRVLWFTPVPDNDTAQAVDGLRQRGCSVQILPMAAVNTEQTADVVIANLSGNATESTAVQPSLSGRATPILLLLPTATELAQWLPDLAGCQDATVAGEGLDVTWARLQRLVRNHRQAMSATAQDALTGLDNRVATMDWVQQAALDDGPELTVQALVMLDLDHFKQINDSAGHAAGDLVLQAVAEMLKGQLMQGDRCGRYGGEEFVLLLRRSSVDELRTAIEPLLQVSCAVPAGSSAGSASVIDLTLSAGIALSEAGLSGTAWLERADRALYESKAQGRHRATFFEEMLGGDGDTHSLQMRHFDNVTRVVTQRVASLVSLMGQQMLRSLEREARQDALTGVANRGQFDKRAIREVERARRDHRPRSLLFIDIDEFGRFNREHGAPVGDAVLRHFAKTVDGALRPIDWLARYGGEEFCVVMQAQADAAVAAADRLREVVAQSSLEQTRGPALKITVSIGVAQHDGSSETVEQWVQRASSALQQAKRAGRNRVVCADNAITPSN
ncbi:diguanylate cyclase [Pseudaquabacterium pictum]|nr:GGDEF domain-containing protein [Rubrivivax pictus]